MSLQWGESYQYLVNVYFAGNKARWLAGAFLQDSRPALQASYKPVTSGILIDFLSGYRRMTFVTGNRWVFVMETIATSRTSAGLPVWLYCKGIWNALVSSGG